MTGRLPAREEALRWGILAGIALLLLTPFVVTPSTLFPLVVGKALWSRSIVAVVLALWVLLALRDPAYRPPRSWLLLLLAVDLGVSLVSAWFGVSVQRSLWSDYERMQGLVDRLHWLALAVVVASVLRTVPAWRTLLAAATVASAALACLVIARYHGIDVPFYGAIPETHLPRVRGPFGNPTYLSVYMLAHLVVALGFALQSWLPASATDAASPAQGSARRRRGRAAAPPRPRPGGRRPRWPSRLFWALAVAVHLQVLVLAGSVGGFAGLFASIGAVALAGAFLSHGRRRWAAAALAGVLCLTAAGVGLRFVHPDRAGAFWLSNAAARYVATVHLQRPGVQSRLAAWEAGLAGFAARPLLGWGPGNFGTVFGRFASGYGAVAEPHDQAHGKLVEVAATTGSLGVAAYLALWSWTFLVVWRAVRRAGPPDRTLVLFAGAALLGGLVQSQTLFDTTVGSLQTAILLGFVAGREATAFPDGRVHRLPARLWAACAGLLGRRATRTALAAAALGAALAGVLVCGTIHAAANVGHLPTGPASLRAAARGIDGFRPLANTYRWWLLNMAGVAWPRLRSADAGDAGRLLAWVEREAEELLRTEPERWRYHHSLAQMYRTVASTDGAYEGRARRALARAREAAPNRPVFSAPLAAPRVLEARRLDDGRHQLRWVASAGAGYHVVAEMRGDGARHFLFHAYDAARTSFVRAPPRTPGAYRYGVKACRFPRDCSAWVEWPAITEPGNDAAREKR